MGTTASHQIEVRPATHDDIEFMVHLFLQIRYQMSPNGDGMDVDAIVTGTRIATREQVEGTIPDSITNVIEVDGQPAGRLRVVRDDQIQIAGLQIMPAFQRRGVATAVITDLINEAAGKKPLVLDVDKDNPAAERLYRRLGFERTDETADAYLMRHRNA